MNSYNQFPGAELSIRFIVEAVSLILLSLFSLHSRGLKMTIAKVIFNYVKYKKNVTPNVNIFLSMSIKLAIIIRNVEGCSLVMAQELLLKRNKLKPKKSVTQPFRLWIFLLHNHY